MLGAAWCHGCRGLIEEGDAVEFLLDYADFLLRTLTVLVAIIVVLLTIAALRGRGRGKGGGQLQVHKLNDFYKALRERLQHELLDKAQLKALRKAEAKQEKQEKKAGDVQKARVFVLDFDGDIKASATDNLRHEVTALLSMAG